MSRQEADIKAVIIDFDDTLSLTEEGCFFLENEVLATLGHGPMSREIHKSTWGQKMQEAMLTRAPGISIEDFNRVFPEVHSRFVDEGKVDVLTDENLRALKTIRNAGMLAMILTSRTRPELIHLLAKDSQLQGRIDAFYHWDNMEFHKPDPRAFAHIEVEHGLTPNQCVYIGDSPSDAASATGAGLHFIACLESGLRTPEEFAPFPVMAYVDRFSDITSVLKLPEV